MDLKIGSIVILALCAMTALADTWKPAPSPLKTPWADKVDPNHVLPDYPRPAMVRKQWMNLNGLWDFAAKVAPESQAKIKDKILVPFAVESSLSGIGYQVQPSDILIYSREFTIPKDWGNDQVLINFDAVDWSCKVYVNDRFVGSHAGGYDRFTFDIRPFLTESDPQKLRVEVTDPGNTGGQPNGKQVLKPGGIWYTGTSGIWQTVWLEPVSDRYIRSYHVETKKDGSFKISVNVPGEFKDPVAKLRIPGADIEAELRPKGGLPNPLVFEGKIRHAKLWSPDTPYLYDFTLSLEDGSDKLDEVKGYFGVREIEVAKDKSGINRLMLNGEPTFMFGPLDQGFNPDGLHTYPTEDCFLFDLKAIKDYGCNMLRKHIKVEPDRYYYACDKMGIMVWQDMPSMSEQPFLNKPEFESELTRMIETHWNYPSIVMWVPFNEGWGQYDTERITSFVERKDPTRLVNNASGWVDHGVGSVSDAHVYPGPGMPDLEEKRASVLGEFGGLGLPVAGHTWLDKGNWGYVKFNSPKEVTDAYVDLITNLRALVPLGLCAAVYTQTTDVEVETNGWMTYDRKVFKIDQKRAREATLKLYDSKNGAKLLVPPAGFDGAFSKYTNAKPDGDWAAAKFDDSTWSTGKGRYTNENPAVPHTAWLPETPDIWIRREVNLDSTSDLKLLLLHDDDVEVYINGVLALSRKGAINNFVLADLSPEAKKALKKGKNLIAVHCNSPQGRQHVDIGLVSVK
ncbi:MAG: glycoside hydrolase family 2 [Armatimonadetes bacterium]|nr:glycoside hydrolase family 2 [Armatimonadota bacterium]